MVSDGRPLPRNAHEPHHYAHLVGLPVFFIQSFALCLLFTCLLSPLFAFLPEDVVEGVCYELCWGSVVCCVCMTHPWYAARVCLVNSLARLECVTSTVRCAEAHSRWSAIWLQRHFLSLSDRYVRSLRREYRLFVGRFISSRDLRLSKFHNRGIIFTWQY